jgi:hypothetical protein
VTSAGEFKSKEIAVERNSTFGRNALVLSALLAATVCAAQTLNAPESFDMAPLPPQQMQGDVTYITGGVGQEEAMTMRKEAARFPLSLEFIRNAGPNVEFLADINVTITDQQGRTVLATMSDGPMLLANVPAGKYTVTADDHGLAKARNVVVTGRPEHLVFEW